MMIMMMQETIDVLTAKNAQLLAEREAGNWLSTEGAGGDITSMIEKYVMMIVMMIMMMILMMLSQVHGRD